MADAGQKRILVVEGEAVVAAQLAAALPGLGFALAGVAATAAEARAKARALAPDLALMDVFLQGQPDGVEACRAIQSGLSIPVVLFSDSLGPECAERVSRAEPSGFVAKPFQAHLLRLTLEAALRKGSPTGAGPSGAAAEDSFRAVFEAAPASVFITTAEEGRILAVNERFLRARGMALEEVLGRTSLELGLVSAKQRAAMAGIIASAGRVENLELRLPGPPEDRVCLVSAQLHRFAGQDCWLTIAVDVTARKRAEEEREAFRSMVDASRDRMCLIGRDGVYRAANLAYCQALGRRERSVAGRPAAEVLGEAAFAQDMQPHLERCLAGEIVLCEQWLPLRGGGQGCFEVTFTPMAPVRKGGVEFATVVFHDITRFKAAEEALGRNQRLLAEGERLSHTGTWDLDLGAGRGVASDNMYRLLGYEPGEIPASPEFFFSRMHSEDAERIRKFWEEGLAACRAFEVECRVITKQGAVRCLHGAAEFAAGPDGRAARAFGAVRDTTWEKMAEQDLQAAWAQTRSATGARSEFLASLSHEIRTPLNGVLGMAELALGGALDAAQRGNLEMLRESGHSLLRVLNNILDISRIEAGIPAADEPRRFRLGDLLSEVADSFRSQAEAKGLTLEAEATPAADLLAAGPDISLRQALCNLVGHAVKFTAQGGVRLAAHLLGEARENGLRQALFCVEDTGAGIPQEDLPRLFAPLVPADDLAALSLDRTGLALLRRALGRLGGGLCVDSAPGQGTTVHFTLGLRDAAAVAEAPAPEPAAPERLKVLVAEDNAVSRLYALRLLERMGHEARGAADGLEALRALESERFDLALMDVRMPGRDGLAATRALRESRGWATPPHVPVVAMTAHALEGDQERFLAGGMDDYLAKPMEPRDLQAVLARVMSRCRGR